MGTRVIGDVHLGNFRLGGGESVGGVNHRAALVEDTLCRAIGWSSSVSLVQLGDFFDSPNPGNGIVASALRQLGRRRTHILVGNHDSDTAGSAGALQVLHDAHRNYRVYREPKLFRGATHTWLFVPFAKGKAIDHIQAALLAHKKEKAMMLAFHAGIWDEETPEFMRNSPDSVSLVDLMYLANTYQLRGIWAGNWHNHRRWSTNEVDLCPIIQVGALCPTGWDNPGTDYGHVYVPHIYGRGFDHFEVSHPVFETVEYEGPGHVQRLWQKPKHPKASHMFYKIKCLARDRAEIEAEIKACNMASNGTSRFTYVISPTKTKETKVFIPTPGLSAADAVSTYATDPQVRAQAVTYLEKANK